MKIMRLTKKLLIFTLLFLTFFFRTSNIFAEDIIETLNLIQKDLKTLEKAVYSGNAISSSESSNSENNYSEDALTRHLLKLSDIEKQFQELTNKFEEINFKIVKFSNRLSKIQSDNNNQIFHAGTYEKNGKIYSSGGRVLNFVTLSNSLREARKKGSSLIKKLNWNNGFFRKDIGWKSIINNK